MAIRCLCAQPQPLTNTCKAPVRASHIQPHHVQNEARYYSFTTLYVSRMNANRAFAQNEARYYSFTTLLVSRMNANTAFAQNAARCYLFTTLLVSRMTANTALKVSQRSKVLFVQLLGCMSRTSPTQPSKPQKRSGVLFVHHVMGAP